MFMWLKHRITALIMSKMQKVYILKAAAWTMTMSMADVFEMHSGDDLTPPLPKKRLECFSAANNLKAQRQVYSFFHEKEK